MYRLAPGTPNTVGLPGWPCTAYLMYQIQLAQPMMLLVYVLCVGCCFSSRSFLSHSMYICIFKNIPCRIARLSLPIRLLYVYRYMESFVIMDTSLWLMYISISSNENESNYVYHSTWSMIIQIYRVWFEMDVTSCPLLVPFARNVFLLVIPLADVLCS